MKKHLILSIVFIFLINLAYPQKYIDDQVLCYKNKKTNNFTEGDTLYTNCNFVILGEGVSYDDFYSPLLDSLVVYLKKSPETIIILNAWQPISKESYANVVKSHRENDTNVLKVTYIQANHIAYYLQKRGVTNCIICNGNGYRTVRNGTLTRKEELCQFATQVILTKSDTLHCYSLEPNKPVVLQNIYFDVDKWELQSKSYNELNLFANYLRNNPTLKIEISGHTDNTGDYNENILLSKNRANEVALYLKNKLVKNNITTVGYGSSKPLRTNSTELGRSQNRRIEVKLIK